MEAKRAEAFAPAAISNFFQIHDEPLKEGYSDLSRVGATGGGFTLSKGVRTVATAQRAYGPAKIRIVVNDDPTYVATTTRRAVEMLLEHATERSVQVELAQQVQVPIGYGFGTSAASALSAVMAVSSALELPMRKEEVASLAHAAEIICQTGLGTVSSIYDHAGAGLILSPGGPGIARVANVEVPEDVRLVTASLGPYRKSDLLSSTKMRDKVNELGKEAMRLASPLTFTGLLRAGERFAKGLGLETPQVRRLEDVAISHGALGASQNMIGHAVHALVQGDKLDAVASALESDPIAPRVDIFRIGSSRAQVLRTEVVDYPRTRSSFV